ncbi:hypothetical protein EJ07DRAFT_150155 [Lizonia empirigonia]|nr:hypothetical protein EJ07DRAFT_150155 [Lizonia empirigonia]
MRQAKEVSVDGVEGVVFRSTPCIGAKPQGGIVVFVVSDAAAACGHAQPPVGYPFGDVYIRAFMDRFNEYVKRWSEYFPSESSAAWIGFASSGSCFTPSEQGLIESKLRDAGISNITTLPYNSYHTVLIESRGEEVKILLEYN